MESTFAGVKTYPKEYEILDDDIGFMVIISRCEGKRCFVKHKERDTREIPGGHRESGETILEGAKRELYEETGAIRYEIEHIGYYSLVRGDNPISHGAVFVVDIFEFGELPLEREMEEMRLFDKIPENVTYPDVHPLLFDMIKDNH